MSSNRLIRKRLVNRYKRKQSLNRHFKKRGGEPDEDKRYSIRRSVSTRNSLPTRRSVPTSENSSRGTSHTRRYSDITTDTKEMNRYRTKEINRYRTFLAPFETADYGTLECCIDKYPFRDEIRMVLNENHAIELINAQVIYQNKLVKTKRILRNLFTAYMVGEEKIQKFIYANDGESRSKLNETPQNAGNGQICFYSDKDEAYGEQYGSNHEILNRLKQRDTERLKVSRSSKLYVYDDDAVIACTANLEMTYRTDFKYALGGKTGFSNRYMIPKKNATSDGYVWVAMPHYRKVELKRGEETVFDPDYIVMAEFEKNAPLPTIEKLFKIWTSKRGWQRFLGPCTIYLSAAMIPSEVESRMNGTPGPQGPQGPKGSSGGMLDTITNLSILNKMIQ